MSITLAAKLESSQPAALGFHRFYPDLIREEEDEEEDEARKTATRMKTATRILALPIASLS